MKENRNNFFEEGKQYFTKGYYFNALKVFDQIVENDPESAKEIFKQINALKLAALCCLKIEKPEESYKYFNIYYGHQDYDANLFGSRWAALGVVLKKEGEYENASKCFAFYLEYHPRSSDTLSHMGNCYLSMKDSDNAFKYFYEASKLKQFGPIYQRDFDNWTNLRKLAEEQEKSDIVKRCDEVIRKMKYHDISVHCTVLANQLREKNISQPRINTIISGFLTALSQNNTMDFIQEKLPNLLKKEEYNVISDGIFKATKPYEPVVSLLKMDNNHVNQQLFREKAKEYPLKELSL